MQMHPTDPETLLVAQAAFAASSVVPVTRVARSITGQRAGLLVGLAYAGSYGLQSMVGFDFHEVALAVPLLAFGLEAYLGGRYTRAAVLIGAACSESVTGPAAPKEVAPTAPDNSVITPIHGQLARA